MFTLLGLFILHHTIKTNEVTKASDLIPAIVEFPSKLVSGAVLIFPFSDFRWQHIIYL